MFRRAKKTPPVPQPAPMSANPPDTEAIYRGLRDQSLTVATAGIVLPTPRHPDVVAALADIDRRRSGTRKANRPAPETAIQIDIIRTRASVS